MPTYFYNVYPSGEPPYLDEIGDELADDAAAWRIGLIAAGQSIRDLARKLRPGSDWRMDVVNQQGRVLYRFTFNAKAEGSG